MVLIPLFYKMAKTEKGKKQEQNYIRKIFFFDR